MRRCGWMRAQNSEDASILGRALSKVPPQIVPIKSLRPTRLGDETNHRIEIRAKVFRNCFDCLGCGQLNKFALYCSEERSPVSDFRCVSRQRRYDGRST